MGPIFWLQIGQNQILRNFESHQTTICLCLVFGAFRLVIVAYGRQARGNYYPPSGLL